MSTSHHANTTRGNYQREHPERSEGALDLFRLQQDAERRAGIRPRTIAEISAEKRQHGPTNLKQRVGAGLVDLTPRQLRRRGPRSRVALQLDQDALTERSPAVQAVLRDASSKLKSLPDKPAQIAFDLIGGGNRVLGNQYVDSILGGLASTGFSHARKQRALAVLIYVWRWVRFGTYECYKNAAELADLAELHPAHMSRTLKDLEDIGAIKQTRRGRVKIIVVTPEGLYCGAWERRDLVQGLYLLEVVHADSIVPSSVGEAPGDTGSPG
jgi:hypothetical protein